MSNTVPEINETLRGTGCFVREMGGELVLHREGSPWLAFPLDTSASTLYGVAVGSISHEEPSYSGGPSLGRIFAESAAQGGGWSLGWGAVTMALAGVGHIFSGGHHDD